MPFLVYEPWEHLKILILELIPEIRVQHSKCDVENLEDAGTGVHTSSGALFSSVPRKQEKASGYFQCGKREEFGVSSETLPVGHIQRS